MKWQSGGTTLKLWLHRLGLNGVLLVLCLAAMAITVPLVKFQPAELVLQSQDTQRKADLRRLQLALKEYAADHDGQYPKANSTVGYYSCYRCGWPGAETDAVNGLPFDRHSWIPDLVAQGYMTTLPVDPLGGVAPGCSSSGYIYLSGGVGYKIFDWCAPRTGLHQPEAEGAYCSRPPYDGTNLNPNPANYEPLKELVDPVRPSWGYAVYTFELACY